MPPFKKLGINMTEAGEQQKPIKNCKIIRNGKTKFCDKKKKHAF